MNMIIFHNQFVKNESHNDENSTYFFQACLASSLITEFLYFTGKNNMVKKQCFIMPFENMIVHTSKLHIFIFFEKPSLFQPFSKPRDILLE